MPFPFPSVVDMACAWVPASLMSPSARSRVTEAARAAPQDLSGGFLECPLYTNGERVDLLACARGRAAAARLASPEAWPEWCRPLPFWQRIIAFYERWGASGSTLVDAVPLTLIEFDLEQGAPQHRAPGFHFCVDPAFAEQGWEALPGAPPAPNATELLALTSSVLTMVLGQTPTPELLDRLKRCREALPPGGRILHLSAMTSRPNSPLKLNAVVSAAALPAWLDEAGWPGERERVVEILAQLGQGMRVAKVDVALGATLGARLGLELCFPGHPREDLHWREVFDWLVTEGLCTPAQEEALCQWVGSEDVLFPGTAWPGRMERTLELKLVVEDEAVSAKAYLGFTAQLSLFNTEAPRSQIHRPNSAVPLAHLLDVPALTPPDVLCPPAALERIGAAAPRMPTRCTSLAFEVRMAAGAEQVDLLGYLPAAAASAETERELEQAGWQPVASFMRQWSNPRSSLYGRVSGIWLEVDLDGSPHPRLPNISIGVMARPPGPRASPDRWSEDLLQQVLNEALRSLGVRRQPATNEGVLHCFRALPAGGRLNHLALMLARDTSAVRLALELPLPELGQYLETVEWPGSETDLAPLQTALELGADRLGLALDVGDGLASTLGVEFAFHAPPSSHPRFKALLQHLTDAGFCSPAKQRAYSAWPGRARITGGDTIQRAVHHVKWGLTPGGRGHVKGYLALSRPSEAR